MLRPDRSQLERACRYVPLVYVSPLVILVPYTMKPDLLWRIIVDYFTSAIVKTRKDVALVSQIFG